MKRLSVFILLLGIVLGGGFWMGHSYELSVATFAGQVRVPVYVSSGVAEEITYDALVPLRSNPLPKVQAPSVQFTTKATSDNTGWTMATTSDVHTQSVGGGASSISAGNSFSAVVASVDVSPLGGYTTVLPSIAQTRQPSVTPFVDRQNADNAILRRHASRTTATRPPEDGSILGERKQYGNTWWIWTIDGWKSLNEPEPGNTPDVWLPGKLGEKRTDPATGKIYYFDGEQWVPMNEKDPELPLGDAPWWLVGACLLWYAIRKWRQQANA